MAGFTDTYVPSSRKYVSTEPKIRSFEKLNKKCLGPTTSCLDFKNGDIFTQIQQKRPCQRPVFLLLLYGLEIGHTRKPSQFKIK